MATESFIEWLSMSGYASAVWPGYIITLFALAWIVIRPIVRHKQLVKRLRSPRNGQ